MYAIVRTGGHQYRVEKGDEIDVALMDVAEGDKIQLDEVLLVSSGKKVQVGAPLVDGASVSATVIGEFKDRKVVVFKYKPKSRYRKKTGHRQRYTRVKIDAIKA